MRDRQGARFAVWLALLGVCAWIGMHTPMEPATTWPEGSSREQELLAVYAKNNLDSHLILLMLEGPGADELAHASRQLATALRASDLFLLVANGDPEMTAADRAFLWQHRYLLSTSVAFGAAQIRSGLERANPATLMADPSDEFSQVTAGMPASRANLQHGAWLSLETTRALLFVVTRPSGADAQRIASDVIVRAHAALSSGTRLTLTGPALRATASLNPRPFGGVLVLWGMLILASRRVPWWTIPPVLAALVAGAAAVGLWYGKVQLSNFSFAGILVALALLQSLVHRALAQRQATAWRGIAVHPATLIFVLTIAAAALLMASPVPAAAQAG